MNFGVFVLVALFGVALCFEDTNTETARWVNHGAKKHFACGFITKCSEGFIVLNPFGGVPDHIRCQWTLAVPLATKYKLNVLYAGFNQHTNRTNKVSAGLTVTSLRYESKDADTQQFEEANRPVEVTAQVIVITFFSLENFGDGPGFILEYAATQDKFSGTKGVSKNSEYHRVSFSNPVHTHPTIQNPTPDTLDGRELSIITFMPRGNIVVSPKPMYIKYQKLAQPEDIGCGFQKLEYYALKVEENGDADFVSKGIICDLDDFKRMVVSDITILVIISQRGILDSKRSFQVTYEDPNLSD